MRPTLTVASESEPLGPITVLIVKQFSDHITAQFKHMAKKTHDPAERYQSALQMLSAAYYQRAKEFSDELTALFGPGSATASRLLKEQHCTLIFDEYNQRYVLPCVVRALRPNSDAYQATFWHNSLFNPELPGDVMILGFQPDWSAAEADPPAA